MESGIDWNVLAEAIEKIAKPMKGYQVTLLYRKMESGIDWNVLAAAIEKMAKPMRG